MRFEEAVKLILIEEGGSAISDNKRDPGGVTKYGISKRAYPNLDIKNLTEEDAIEIYRRDYWDRLQLDYMPEAVRLIIFDCAVNQGVGAATGLLQATIGVTADGILGPATIKAMNQVDNFKFIEVYSKARHLRYYMNPKFMVFGGGWTKRLLHITIKSMRELIKG